MIKMGIEQLKENEKTCVYKEKYIVTSSGRVFTMHNNKKGITEQKLRRHNNGYIRACLFGKDVYVHRLVAECFLDNPNGYKEVNHIDGNKENNDVANLEWCDRHYNNLHAFQTGLRSYDDLKKMARMPKIKSRKFSNEQVLAIRNSTLSDTELARQYGTSRGAIYQIKKKISYKEVV